MNNKSHHAHIIKPGFIIDAIFEIFLFEFQIIDRAITQSFPEIIHLFNLGIQSRNSNPAPW